jgi:hypothetical protein
MTFNTVVDANTTVADIHSKLQRAHAIPDLASIEAYITFPPFQSGPLDKIYTLGQIGVANLSTMYAHARLRGGTPRQANTVSGM